MSCALFILYPTIFRIAEINYGTDPDFENNERGGVSEVFSLITTNIDYDEISEGQLAITDFVMAGCECEL